MGTRMNKITHKGSHIERVRDDGIYDYINGQKNTPVNHFEMVSPYNKNLLKKYRKSNIENLE